MDYPKTIEMVNRLVDDGVVPGVNYAFIDGNKVERYLIGNSELIPKKIKLKDNLIYDMASLTKVVGTTMVILKLVDNNQLNMEDSISKYLPQWRYPKVTVRNLITHTSGIEGYINNRNNLNHDDLIKALLNLKAGKGLNHEMHYADVNFIFLGLIAKQITGKSIHDLITEWVLKPLHMHNSSFAPKDKDKCVPTVYDEKKGLLQGSVHDPKAQILGTDCGSAGLFSNMDDLIKFVHAILYPDDNPIISSALVKQFYDDQTYSHALGRSYGFELIHYHGMKFIWQSGYTGTFIVIIPKLKRAMIFLSNRVHPKAPNEYYIERRKPLIETYLDENKKAWK
ncbi:serine hydrolase domain-containing protein [Apilactobacillus timberlakei]|uniref:Class A beta-lactamase-related serine hydrolase n=1 Tax=Apilactobacillus timberlakei TaxID=2008380 RepID=A0ABY2YRW6_9LACO|nr:serine hydrolase domain-containing protein [Apilactobacillus timberlakei]TPR13458.1 class A beta-lactamase-related serine hydrolase [Apilactobacillus timberlakei]TPR15531.1 class A beta-lactamase-related serine hydrolase [Apilactobacillus timberlakei]